MANCSEENDEGVVTNVVDFVVVIEGKRVNDRVSSSVAALLKAVVDVSDDPGDPEAGDEFSSSGWDVADDDAETEDELSFSGWDGADNAEVDDEFSSSGWDGAGVVEDADTCSPECSSPMIKDIAEVSSSSNVELGDVDSETTLGSVEIEISVRVESDEIELVSGMFDDEEDRSEAWLVSPTEELDKIVVGVVGPRPC